MLALGLVVAAYSARGTAPGLLHRLPVAPGAAQAATTPAQTPQDRVREMDAGHEAGVKAFPAPTAGKGAQPLAPEIAAGVKVFKITASEIDWEITPGVKKTAFAYNGAVPGPTIRVTEGDRVRLILKNNLKESTSIHFHGLLIPNNMDGVPFITQPPVKPGESFTYEFTARNPGSHMYHSHHAADRQVPLGLLGAFIIEPKNRSAEPKVSQDQILILNDGFFGYTINGKGFPATAPIVAKNGEWIRVRFMNEGSDDPPDAPPRHADAGHHRGRLPGPAAVSGRHLEHLAGSAVRRADPRDRTRRVGVSLPSPQPRRKRSRHARHGNGAHRQVIIRRRPDGHRGLVSV